jgi:hypothetical protein
MSSAAALLPTARTIIYLGMDVHKESITIDLPGLGTGVLNVPHTSNGVPRRQLHRE